MKQFLVIILFILLVAGCATSEPETAVEYDAYGVGVTSSVVMTTDELLDDAASLDGELVAVSGVVRDVCQSKGCWLVLETATGDVIRVAVAKDDAGEYQFTVPTDISGRQVLVEGRLVRQELSEEQQQHYAEESNTQTAAPVEYRIEAVGVAFEPARAEV